jgi:diacylglycerol kinase family enzyme
MMAAFMRRFWEMSDRPTHELLRGSHAMTPSPPPLRDAPLFVVFNRASGRGNRDELGPAVQAACKAAGRRCELLPVTRPGQLPEVARDAVRRAQAVDGIVVAAGGDGTINCVAQAVLGSGCRFGVLPRGTFNYFARTHGIPADLDGALRVLLNEAAVPVHAGRVNGRVFLVNASLGLYARLLEEREGWKRQFGRSRFVALLAGVRTILRGHRSLHLDVELQGQSWQARTPTLFVGNNALQMEQVGLPQAQAIDAGCLAGVTLKPVGRLGLLALLARGLFGRIGGADEVCSFAFHSLTVKARRFGARRIKVAADGEVQKMALPLRFEVAAEPLLLIRPPGLAPERREVRP